MQTLDVVREFILSDQSAYKSELDAQLYVCITDDPTLRSHLRARIAQIEDYVAPAIADDLGLPLDDPRTQLVAAAFTAAFNLLADRGASKSRPYTPKELEAQIDRHPIPARRASMRSNRRQPPDRPPFSTTRFSL